MKLHIIIYILLASLNTFGQNNWELRKNKNGIKVYTRKTGNSNIVEFKATTVINTKAENILNTLKNAAEYPQWIDQVDFAKLLSQNGNNFIVYYTIDMPIGFKNRDIVLNNNILQLSQNKIKINLSAVPKQYPEQDKYVRIENANGYWLLSENNGKTTVTYQFFTDPKADFPEWVVNLFIVDGPYETLSNLKQKYQ